MKKGIITLVAFALLTPLTLVAQPGPGGQAFCPDGPRWMGQRHHGMYCDQPGRGDRGPGIGRLLMAADEIGLTDEQEDQLEQLQVDFKMEQIDRKAEMQKARVQLRTLMRDDNAVERDVFRMIDDLSRMKADMQKMRYTHRLQIHSILTEEQIEKMKELRRERRGDGQGMKGRNPHWRKGGWGRP